MHVNIHTLNALHPGPCQGSLRVSNGWSLCVVWCSAYCGHVNNNKHNHSAIRISVLNLIVVGGNPCSLTQFFMWKSYRHFRHCVLAKQQKHFKIKIPRSIEAITSHRAGWFFVPDWLSVDSVCTCFDSHSQSLVGKAELMLFMEIFTNT